MRVCGTCGSTVSPLASACPSCGGPPTDWTFWGDRAEWFFLTVGQFVSVLACVGVVFATITMLIGTLFGGEGATVVGFKVGPQWALALFGSIPAFCYSAAMMIVFSRARGYRRRKRGSGVSCATYKGSSGSPRQQPRWDRARPVGEWMIALTREEERTGSFRSPGSGKAEPIAAADRGRD